MSMARLKQGAKSVLLPLFHRLRRAKRQAELKRQAPPVGRGELKAALDALPVPQESVLLVHSSLKSLGYVEGGARSVVDALVESFVADRRVTVMVPTYSIDGTMHATMASGRPFDVRATPSNLGAIPEAFRRRPDALRSVHPTHSFAAIGPKAEWLLSEHHRAGTNFGPGTPMGRMLETESHLLGLGSDIGHVTFYHCLEDFDEAFPFSVYAGDGPFEVPCVDASGEMHRLRLPAHAPGRLQATRIDHPESTALRSFFTGRLEAEAGLAWHDVMQARCWLVPARAMYQEIRELMRRGITIYTTAAELERVATPAPQR